LRINKPFFQGISDTDKGQERQHHNNQPGVIPLAERRSSAGLYKYVRDPAKKKYGKKPERFYGGDACRIYKNVLGDGRNQAQNQ